MADSELKMLDRIITGDEKCCYLYDPQTRQQSSYWKFLTSPKQQTFCADSSKGKVMLKVFFDSKSIVYHEFIPQGHTVNKTMYRDILHCLKRCYPLEMPRVVVSRKMGSAPRQCACTSVSSG
jgi:hypothetical protein